MKIKQLNNIQSLSKRCKLIRTQWKLDKLVSTHSLYKRCFNLKWRVNVPFKYVLMLFFSIGYFFSFEYRVGFWILWPWNPCLLAPYHCHKTIYYFRRFNWLKKSVFIYKSLSNNGINMLKVFILRILPFVAFNLPKRKKETLIAEKVEAL